MAFAVVDSNPSLLSRLRFALDMFDSCSYDLVVVGHTTGVEVVVVVDDHTMADHWVHSVIVVVVDKVIGDPVMVGNRAADTVDMVGKDRRREARLL